MAISSTRRTGWLRRSFTCFGTGSRAWRQQACQFPIWEHGEHPREGARERFFGEATVRGESWCLHHLAMVSPRRALKLAREAAARSRLS